MGLRTLSCSLLRHPHARAALASCVVLALAGAALARGGGGGNFGGGGGGGGGFGGGSGGGGGGGGGEAIVWLIYLIIRYPLIGIPLAIVLVFLMILGGNKSNHARRSNVMRKGTMARARLAARDVEAELRAADPEFDRATFFGRVTVAFRKVQRAWCLQELGTIRPFVSDGIHERFALQLAEQQDLGYRDHMDDLDVIDLDLAQVEEEGRLQILTVRVVARAADYRVSLADRSFVSGTKQPQTFVEFWSFLRRRGSKSRRSEKGLIEGYCANCGAPVEMNQWSKCEHCQTHLRSGEHDWVLVEVTQESEWRGRHSNSIRGVADFRRADPGFSVQHVEDRVSVMFWRTAMAERLGKGTPMRKIATDELTARWEERIVEGIRRDGRRYYNGERGVGSVEIVGIAAGSPRDRAIADVRWSGTLTSVGPKGVVRRERKSSVITTLFVLERVHDVRTDETSAVSSAHCGGCGAPDPGGDTDACEYCNEVMNDGKRDWVLVDIVARHTDRGRALLAPFRAKGKTSVEVAAATEREVSAPVPATESVLAWMIRASFADGHLHKKEEQRLEHMAERAKISRPRLNELISDARNNRLDAPQPLDATEARQWLEEVAAVALSDGQLQHGEKALLHDLGSHHGMAKADVTLVIGQTRARLYDEAKAALRTEKALRRQRGAR